MHNFANNICKLKEKFVSTYKGNSHIHELVPVKKSDFLPIDEKHISFLHSFMRNNPIYENSFKLTFFDTEFIVYEGDLNQFWIDSIKHDTSYAPFYPTWLLSAYSLALKSKELGFLQLVDIGSGDGRIAFCGEIVGVKSTSIEIDQQLTNLQDNLSRKTETAFEIINSDATKINYSDMKLTDPIFFIGGVPENGEILVESVIENILKIHKLQKTTCFALTGIHTEPKFSKNTSNYGWGKTVKKFHLTGINTVMLPTYWTMEQPFSTPYLFTKYT